MIRVTWMPGDDGRDLPAGRTMEATPVTLSRNARIVLTYLARSSPCFAGVGLIRCECFTDAEPRGVLLLCMALERRGMLYTDARGYRITDAGRSALLA